MSEVSDSWQLQSAPMWALGSASDGFRFLEGDRFSAKALFDFYRDAVFYRKTFWQGNNYRTEHRIAYLVLIICGAIAALPNLLLGAAAQASMVFLAAAGSPILVAFVYERLNGWLEMQAPYRTYLSFGAYGAMIYAPCLLLGSLLGPVGIVPITIGLFWIAYGFYQSFKPNPFRWAVLCAALAAGVAMFFSMPTWLTLIQAGL